jgi:signal transduction histidine kinase
MPKTSIQRRLIAVVILSQLLLATGIFFLSVYLTHRQLRVAFDSALNGRAMSLAALVQYSEDSEHPLEFQSGLVPPPLDSKHPDLYEVSHAGRVLARSENWSQGLTMTTEGRDTQHADVTVDGVRYRALRLENVPILDREPDIPANDVLAVTYASPIEPMARAIGHLRLYIALGCMGLLCVSVPLAVWGLRRGLRPLAALATSAGEVSTTNWELNPPQEAWDTSELAPLTQAMTSMLDGLHRAFTQQREFLANAAHELKTPVAVLKSTLQSLLQRPRSSDEYRQGLEEALDDMARLEKLLHSMLRLARAEQWASGNLRRDLTPVDVGTTCQMAIERLQTVAQQRDVKIYLTTNGSMQLPADADDLELVWSNLLENAIRFSPEGEAVRISLHSENGCGYVEVADKGPGIPASEIHHIFERFHRGDVSRARDTGGYGLGLAISKALVEAYGGTIEPQSQPGEGTRMVVSLPLSR